MAGTDPKVIYFVGRSGHGKSSLVNAVIDTSSAEIGHVVPTTPSAQEHILRTTDGVHLWTLIDSRGIFETTRPSGASRTNAIEELESDLKRYKPDVILYVVSCSEVRNLYNDLQILRATFAHCGQWHNPPVVVVLSKADLFGCTHEWPPETHPTKEQLLKDLMTYMAKEVLRATPGDPIKDEDGLFGYELQSCPPFCYMVPVSALLIQPEILWNVDTLKTAIQLGCCKELERIRGQSKCHIL